MTEGNYARYRGGDPHSGVTKEALCGQIVGCMIDAGIKHRKNADVREKIQNLESQFRAAVDWLPNTSQGVDDESTIRSRILYLCPHYYDLLGVTTDRPSSRPLLMSDSAEAPAHERIISGEKHLMSLAAPSNTKQAKKAVTVEDLVDLRGKAIELCKQHEDKNWTFKEQRLRFLQQREAREQEQATATLQLTKFQLEEVSINARVRVLLARKQLKDADIFDEDIDASLPL